MGNFSMVNFLLLMATEVITTPEEKAACCPEGHFITRMNFTSYCSESSGDITAPMKCNDTWAIYASSKRTFTVNSDGWLVVAAKNLEWRTKPGTFCIGNSKLRTSNGTKIKQTAVLCYYGEEIAVIDQDIFAYALIVSVIFLLITASVYVTLPELRPITLKAMDEFLISKFMTSSIVLRTAIDLVVLLGGKLLSFMSIYVTGRCEPDLEGKIIINFCSSLAIALGILGGMKIIPYSDMTLCAIRGFLAYFFIMASFFWTNAISVQILLSMTRPSMFIINNYRWKGFVWFACYAWGCPTVLTIIMAIINFMPGDHVKPGIGLSHCWFFNDRQSWMYMYSVITILLVVNICIFIYTAFLLWNQSFASRQANALRYKFFMSVRMFIVMGVLWIFEMISTLVESHVVWELLNLLNSLQGLLIFLSLVVFRKRVIRAMHRHGWLDCVAEPVQRFLMGAQDDEELVQDSADIDMGEQQFKQ